MEEEPGLTKFRINTEIIVGDVDLDLAGERNRVIESWRKSEIDSEDALRRLLDLYWANQSTSNVETRAYLMSISTEFPLEADMDEIVAERIYQEALEGY
jgi:hypothetical protein